VNALNGPEWPEFCKIFPTAARDIDVQFCGRVTVTLSESFFCFLPSFKNMAVAMRSTAGCAAADGGLAGRGCRNGGAELEGAPLLVKEDNAWF
jgi:hypothetical protein